MTIETKTLSGGGGSLILPSFNIIDSSLTIKDISSVVTSSNSQFYTTLGANDFSKQRFEVATLSPVADTTEQTIVDTGVGKEGVLTQVKSSTIVGGGDVIVRVTIDGEVFTYNSSLSGTYEVFCIGDYLGWGASSTSGAAVGLGSALDKGWATDQSAIMITPLQSALRGLPIGLVFKDSLKVTIQSLDTLEAGSVSNQAVVSWLDYLPTGVS